MQLAENANQTRLLGQTFGIGKKGTVVSPPSCLPEDFDMITDEHADIEASSPLSLPGSLAPSQPEKNVWKSLFFHRRSGERFPARKKEERSSYIKSLEVLAASQHFIPRHPSYQRYYPINAHIREHVPYDVHRLAGLLPRPPGRVERAVAVDEGDDDAGGEEGGGGDRDHEGEEHEGEVR